MGTQAIAARFHTLFAGSERAHGAYNNVVPDRTRNDGKQKGQATTIREPLTVELWAQHLAGSYGVGVVPIFDDATAIFGAIDIDVYNLNLVELADSLKKFKLPLVMCRTKSGGAHLYLFSANPVPASLMQARLRELAALVGYGSAEVFPKQTAIRAADGDLGSWINAPYFGGADTNRYALDDNGDALSPEAFLVRAEAAKQPPGWFSDSLPCTSNALPDGPPCLQHLMDLGFPPGTWNTGMFNLGVYARKAHPDDWSAHLVQLNAINFPLNKWSAGDLDGIKRSLSKKSYAYQCSNPTLAAHCDRTTCRQRKFGVGTHGSNGLPVLSSLTMLKTDPPVWFLEVEGHRLKFTTAELLNPLTFQERCANHRLLVPLVTRAQWTAHLKPAMENANEVPVAEDGSFDDDGSAKGHFVALLEKFCKRFRYTGNRDEIFLGKPYTDGDKTIFRFIDLMEFLQREKFFDFRRNEVVSMLKDLGAVSCKGRFGADNREIRYWEINAFVTNNDQLPIPKELTEPERQF